MEKTWLKHYDPRVSAEIDADRYASVVDIFEQSVKKFKNKEAFINMGHSITFENSIRCRRSLRLICKQVD
ncbi:hypothetical protein KUC14_25390 [Alteromonas sp. KC14]|nr:hypothetical protein KUC14_25390 [Alteromonas sp. KC14]